MSKQERNSLQSINLNELRQVIEKTIKKAVRNKALNGGTIDGLNVVAIDGTNLFNNQSPHCYDGSGANNFTRQKTTIELLNP